MKASWLYLALIFLLLPLTSYGQSLYSISFDSGIKHTSITGLGVSGDVNIGFSNFLVSLHPLDLNIVKQDRYESNNVGPWNYCYDTENSEIVEPGNCSNNYKKIWGYSADLNYLIDLKSTLLAIGGGYRFGDMSTPYANIDLIFDKRPAQANHYWYSSFAMGKDLFSMGFGIAFSL